MIKISAFIRALQPEVTNVFFVQMNLCLYVPVDLFATAADPGCPFA